MITVNLPGAPIEVSPGLPCLLSDALRLAGQAIPLPCAGNHTCGKCKVTATGVLSPLTPEEERLLSAQERAAGVRLACCAEALGECAITPGQSGELRVLTGGALPRRADAPLFGEGWTFAVDIGTTTVACYLLPPGEGAAVVASGRNAQSGYGADVISRITACAQEGVETLQEAITRQLNAMFAGLLLQVGLGNEAVRGVVLTGNTTMLHLLAGLNPAGIAVSPFTPQSLFGTLYAARAFFPALLPDTQVYLAPCISSYVGADITCAILACDLQPGELLIDVGTNGEMALATDKGLLCCSTAAGPAFEGANLSCGMVAAPGAVTRVEVVDGACVVHTLEELSPRGICGAGAISALAAMLEIGAADETGRLDDPYQAEGFPLGGGVVLTQQDVRQLQLAKAAIAAGVDALLHHSGLKLAQVKTLYLAGGFGNAMDTGDAAAIGLIPPMLTDKVRLVGNAAGMGACMCADAQSALEDAQRIARRAQVVELSSDGFFNDRYIEQMMFDAEFAL